MSIGLSTGCDLNGRGAKVGWTSNGFRSAGTRIEFVVVEVCSQKV